MTTTIKNQIEDYLTQITTQELKDNNLEVKGADEKHKLDVINFTGDTTTNFNTQLSKFTVKNYNLDKDAAAKIFKDFTDAFAKVDKKINDPVGSGNYPNNVVAVYAR